MSEADMPGTNRFLTLADTADVLSVSASQVYALVRSGELPAIKVGGHGHWRIERSVLETYVADRYEEARRIGLWNQSEFASIQELALESAERFGARGAQGTRGVRGERGVRGSRDRENE